MLHVQPFTREQSCQFSSPSNLDLVVDLLLLIIAGQVNLAEWSLCYWSVALVVIWCRFSLSLSLSLSLFLSLSSGAIFLSLSLTHTHTLESVVNSMAGYINQSKKIKLTRSGSRCSSSRRNVIIIIICVEVGATDRKQDAVKDE